MRYLLLATTCAIMSFSEIAYAEVLDKEWSIHTILIFGLLNAVLLLAISKYKPIYLLLLLPISAFLCFAQLSDVLDPSVGPAIKNEMGNFYIFVSFSIPIIWICSCIAGFWFSRKQRVSSTALGR